MTNEAARVIDAAVEAQGVTAAEKQRSRDAIVAAVADALARIYFDEICVDEQSAEQLLQTAARMKALHEAIVTARDLLGIIDKAASVSEEPPAQAGVVVLPDVTGAE